MSAAGATRDGLSADIGRAVAVQRVARGLTQRELAARLGITTTRLATWEIGRNAMSVGWGVRVAEELETTVDELAKGDER